MQGSMGGPRKPYVKTYTSVPNEVSILTPPPLPSCPARLEEVAMQPAELPSSHPTHPLASASSLTYPPSPRNTHAHSVKLECLEWLSSNVSPHACIPHANAHKSMTPVTL